MNKVYEELVEGGLDCASSIILSWEYFDHDDKKSFNFKDLLLVWSNIPDYLPREIKEEIWTEIKARIKEKKDFNHALSFFEKNSPESKEAIELIEILKEISSKIGNAAQIFKIAPLKSPKGEKNYLWFKKFISNFEKNQDDKK